MSNLHGYNDYHGPRLPGQRRNLRKIDSQDEKNDKDDDNSVDDPLSARVWMEGDSLAPPCGSSIPLVRAVLDFASVDTNDIMYDLGCGDGRVLLEAIVRKHCNVCVGVELEVDLVQRANQLIEALPTSINEARRLDNSRTPRIQVIQADLRDVLKSFVSRTTNYQAHNENTIQGQRDYSALPLPTIIVIALLPEAMNEIEEDLISLLPYTRIVCIAWGLTGIKPIDEKEIYNKRGASTSVFLYTKECLERLKGFEYMLSVYHGH